MTSKRQKEINTLKIWDHQKDALKQISEYIGTYSGAYPPNFSYKKLA